LLVARVHLLEKEEQRLCWVPCRFRILDRARDLLQVLGVRVYRGTSLIRNSPPPPGPP